MKRVTMTTKNTETSSIATPTNKKWVKTTSKTTKKTTVPNTNTTKSSTQTLMRWTTKVK